MKQNYAKVIFIEENNFEQIFADADEKVIALDPDIVGWTFTNETIEKIKNLGAICLETTGYEWVDCDYCAKKGIVVTNVPKYSTNAVAEKALFMALALAKKFPLFLREGKMNWAQEFIADDMKNAFTGIVGFGDIGARLANMLENIVGVERVCYYSRKDKKNKSLYMGFDEMIEKCEYLFVTLSKNKESLALFNDISKFNKNMKVVIIANGFEDVAKRLAQKCEKHEIGGVAFESDDLTKEYKTNIFVTPHNAYYTKEALVNMFEIWTETIISAKNKPINKVN
ncbi:MAG: hypothetical protein FWC00_05885 [Firmicutes bacterium]|nr:hypothetical protein [Bacillota bacterium]